MSPARRRGGFLVPALVALLLVGVAVGALLWWDVQRPVRGQCFAALPDGSVETLDGEQSDNAALMAAVAEHRGLPARATTVAIATAIQESKLSNIDYGDRDSVGLFQQRPSQGWGTVEQIMDPLYSTNAFYDVLVKVQGWESAEITDAAQDVQRSAFPTAYAQHETVARAFASALTGHSPAALTCALGEPDGGYETAGSPARLAGIADRMAHDYTALTTEVGEAGVLVADARELPGGAADPTRMGWGVAQWAVGTAPTTGASLVAVEDRVWLREEASRDDAAAVAADGAGARWHSLAELGDDPRVAPLAAHLTDGRVPEGRVLVR